MDVSPKAWFSEAGVGIPSPWLDVASGVDQKSGATSTSRDVNRRARSSETQGRHQGRRYTATPHARYRRKVNLDEFLN